MLPDTPGMIIVAAATAPITSRMTICPTSTVMVSGLDTSPVSAMAMMPAKNNTNTPMETPPSFLCRILASSGLSPPRMRPMKVVEVGKG